MSKDYYYYIQEVDKDSQTLIGEPIEIENHFKGLLYSKCTGMDDYGKAKNIYTETYADSDKVRTYIPTEIAREATKAKLTLYFVGKNRQKVYHDFVAFITGKRMCFWDTKRRKRMYFYFQNKSTIGDEEFVGSTPYMQADFELQNIYGCTFDVTDEND